MYSAHTFRRRVLLSPIPPIWQIHFSPSLLLLEEKKAFKKVKGVFFFSSPFGKVGGERIFETRKELESNWSLHGVCRVRRDGAGGKYSPGIPTTSEEEEVERGRRRRRTGGYGLMDLLLLLSPIKDRQRAPLSSFLLRCGVRRSSLFSSQI